MIFDSTISATLFLSLAGPQRLRTTFWRAGPGHHPPSPARRGSGERQLPAGQPHEDPLVDERVGDAPGACEPAPGIRRPGRGPPARSVRHTRPARADRVPVGPNLRTGIVGSSPAPSRLPGRDRRRVPASRHRPRPHAPDRWHRRVHAPYRRDCRSPSRRGSTRAPTRPERGDPPKPAPRGGEAVGLPRRGREPGRRSCRPRRPRRRTRMPVRPAPCTGRHRRGRRVRRGLPGRVLRTAPRSSRRPRAAPGRDGYNPAPPRRGRRHPRARRRTRLRWGNARRTRESAA